MSYARRLLRALDLPKGLSRLLAHDRYWRADVVEALCDACDEGGELTDALNAERLAEAAYDLTTRLRHVEPSLKVRVLYTLGTARRRQGFLSQAERCYRTAWQLIDRGGVPLGHAAALAERHAVLLREQGLHDSALEMIRYSLLLGESIGRPTGPARVVEGIVLVYLEDLTGAKACFTSVLLEADPKTQTQLYYAALENMACLFGIYGSPEDLIEAGLLMAEVRRAIRGIRRTPIRYRLDWIDAVLHRRLGDVQRARRDLERARRGFLRLEMLAEVAIVTTELAAVEIEVGRSVAVAPLLADTLDWLRSIDVDSPMVGVYVSALERDGVRAMVEALHQSFESLIDAGRRAPVPLSGAGVTAGNSVAGHCREPRISA